MRFKVLDGWRGIAALLVALFHLKTNGYFYELSVIRHAYLFVDFFFVLSGFVISHAYLDKVGDWPELKSFVIRRIGRLWPLHVAILTAFIGLQTIKLWASKLSLYAPLQAPFSGGFSINSIWTNLLLIQSLGFHRTLTWNDPSWSISTEFYVYIVFAGACILVAKNSAFRQLLTVGLAGLGCMIIFLFTDRSMDTTYDLGFFRCLYGFFMGQFTYLIWRSKKIRLLEGAFPEVATLAMVLAFVSFGGFTSWAIAAPIVFGCAIWVFAQEIGPVSQIMKCQAIQSLGVWSYSIYMGHALLLEILNFCVRAIERRWHILIFRLLPFPEKGGTHLMIVLREKYIADFLALMYLVAVVFIAAITYQLIEQPGRVLFNRLSVGRLGKTKQ